MSVYNKLVLEKKGELEVVLRIFSANLRQLLYKFPFILKSNLYFLLHLLRIVIKG